MCRTCVLSFRLTQRASSAVLAWSQVKQVKDTMGVARGTFHKGMHIADNIGDLGEMLCPGPGSQASGLTCSMLHFVRRVFDCHRERVCTTGGRGGQLRSSSWHSKFEESMGSPTFGSRMLTRA